MRYKYLDIDRFLGNFLAVYVFECLVIFVFSVLFEVIEFLGGRIVLRRIGFEG